MSIFVSAVLNVLVLWHFKYKCPSCDENIYLCRIKKIDGSISHARCSGPERFIFVVVGKDLIGLAQTGSGKTGAFVLPILQALLEAQRPFFACVLSPTRLVIFFRKLDF